MSYGFDQMLEAYAACLKLEAQLPEETLLRVQRFLGMPTPYLTQASPYVIERIVKALIEKANNA